MSATWTASEAFKYWRDGFLSRVPNNAMIEFNEKYVDAKRKGILRKKRHATYKTLVTMNRMRHNLAKFNVRGFWNLEDYPSTSLFLCSIIWQKSWKAFVWAHKITDKHTENGTFTCYLCVNDHHDMGGLSIFHNSYQGVTPVCYTFWVSLHE